MFEMRPVEGLAKPQLYREIAQQMEALLAHERDGIANAANAAALLYHSLADVNWVGFYFLQEGELVLGPFQGKPACVRIAVGKGVCGRAVAERRTLRVADVLSFPDHIACDSASRSELVVPLIKEGKILGVLDLDSPSAGRFDIDDQNGLERIAAIVLGATDFT